MLRSGPSGVRAQALLDVALILWTAAWLWMGITVGRDVRGLGELSGTVDRLGRAVTTVGGVIGELPIIGDQVAGPAEEISGAGRDAVASAGEARENERDVGLLLGISIALIPSSPVLLLYLPRRLGLARERRALRSAIRDERDQRSEQRPVVQRDREHDKQHGAELDQRQPVRDQPRLRRAPLALP